MSLELLNITRGIAETNQAQMAEANRRIQVRESRADENREIAATQTVNWKGSHIKRSTAQGQLDKLSNRVDEMWLDDFDVQDGNIDEEDLLSKYKVGSYATFVANRTRYESQMIEYNDALQKPLSVEEVALDQVDQSANFFDSGDPFLPDAQATQEAITDFTSGRMTERAKQGLLNGDPRTVEFFEGQGVDVDTLINTIKQQLEKEIQIEVTNPRVQETETTKVQ
jgi:hypothetical protein